jgi:hypothetical protein
MPSFAFDWSNAKAKGAHFFFALQRQKSPNASFAFGLCNAKAKEAREAKGAHFFFALQRQKSPNA